MNEKPLKVVMADIARVTGQPLATVRRHRREGVFRIEDLGSVVRYASAYVLLRDAKAEPCDCDETSEAATSTSP